MAENSSCTFDIGSDYNYAQRYFKTWILSQVLGNTDPLNSGGRSVLLSMNSNITQPFFFAKKIHFHKASTTLRGRKGGY